MNKKKKTILYWSPSLVDIATNKAVINSIYSLNRYSDGFSCHLINFFGEFDRFKKEIDKKKINLINYFHKKIFFFLPKHGKIRSRLSFVVMFLLAYFPLKKLIKKDKPDYIIIHLITSLPLILLLFNKFETRFILRISGHPKMNFIRKFLWHIAFKKLYIVTCPTKNTLNYIKDLNIIDPKKIKLLYDPVLNINEINKKKKEIINFKNYFLSVGRLTKQKNFMFLCENFKKIVEKHKEYKILIAGSGEEKLRINKFIKKNNLEKNIILLGHVDNIYPYYKNSKGFILTSLWEDPGFVLIEASFCRTPILSANSWPGPVELIRNNINGILYESNISDSFQKKFNEFLNKKNYQNFKLNNLILSKKFTLFNHYKKLNTLLSH